MLKHPEPGDLSSHDRNRPHRGRPATPRGAGALSWERAVARKRKRIPGPLREIVPAEPIAPWFGGTRYLARRIIERIEAVPHDCFAEPFVGMGGVFLRRSKRPKSEIINLFRIMREHPDELARQFRWVIASRREFRRLLVVPPETLTDVQRAARFATLQRLAFAGVPATSGMNMTAHHPAKLTAPRMQRLIEAAHERLQGWSDPLKVVQIC